MMMVMMLKWNLLVKITFAVILGNADAIVSHQVMTKIPIWAIDIYAIPIEFVFMNGVISGLKIIYKRVKNAR